MLPDGRPASARPTLRSQSGNAAVALIGGVAVVVTLIVGLTDMAVYVMARTRAQTAADAAALAAAAELIPVIGEDPHGKAQEFAAANGARLRRCECERGTGFAEVGVSVPVRMALSVLADVTEVKAEARAEVTAAAFGGADP